MTSRTGRWLLLATAVVQAASPALAGFDQGDAQDPVIVPPGPFFAVWGVVVLGCLAVAVRGLAAERADSATFRRLHVLLSLTQVGFALWLLLAAVAPVLTVPVFAAMLGLLALALRRAPAADGGDHRLVEVVLGVYAGWTAAAVWVNAATVTGSPSTGTLAALLVGAVVTAVVLVTAACRTTASRIAAGATATWALTGVTASTAAADATALAALAVTGIVAVVLAVTLPVIMNGRGAIMNG